MDSTECALGNSEADLRTGEIRKAGSRVKLQDQPFKVLQILLENPGNVVSREELQSRIWPDDSYGDFDHAVNVAVGKLRTALGDSAENPSFIETVPASRLSFRGNRGGPAGTSARKTADWGRRRRRAEIRRKNCRRDACCGYLWPSSCVRRCWRQAYGLDAAASGRSRQRFSA
jgi:hypothetical protein